MLKEINWLAVFITILIIVFIAVIIIFFPIFFLGIVLFLIVAGFFYVIYVSVDEVLRGL